jgi:hypothetical protein
MNTLQKVAVAVIFTALFHLANGEADKLFIASYDETTTVAELHE